LVSDKMMTAFYLGALLWRKTKMLKLNKKQTSQTW
jgi:hypothetical protein